MFGLQKDRYSLLLMVATVRIGHLQSYIIYNFSSWKWKYVSPQRKSLVQFAFSSVSFSTVGGTWSCVVLFSLWLFAYVLVKIMPDKTKLLSMTTILTYSQLNFETSLHASTQSLCGSFNYRLCACVYACARMITLCCGTDLKYITLHIY